MSAIVKIESTKAKARFASLAAQANAKDLAITRHGHIQAYVVSPERYAHLSAVEHVGADVMRKLDDDFDALVERMQSAPQARVARRLATAPLRTILAGVAPSRSARKSHVRKKPA